MSVSFAENTVSYADGQQNVNQPSDAILLNGFTPRTVSNPGMPLPAQWLNWLFRLIFRLLNRDVTTTAAGVGLFTTANATLQLYAVDRADANKFLFAVGYKGADGTAPVLRVVDSQTLAIGSITTSGNVTITGGADVVVTGMSRQIGDL